MVHGDWLVEYGGGLGTWVDTLGPARLAGTLGLTHGFLLLSLDALGLTHLGWHTWI